MKFNLNKINSTLLATAGLFVLVVGGGFAIIHNKTTVESQTIEAEVISEASAEIAVAADSTAPEAVAPVEEAAAPSDMDIFAQCLTEKSATLYGASWCPHCQKQKKAFGESVQYVNYIECAVDGGRTQTEVCATAGIQGYPTWKFADGSEILGEASFEQLAEKTSCPL